MQRRQKAVLSWFNGAQLAYHSPQIRGVAHRGAAGRRKPSLSAGEKWETVKEKWPGK